MIHGLRSSAGEDPDYELALMQHQTYVSTLNSLGLKITLLDPDSRFPDSTFVEDVALCTPELAVIANPGAATRKGEQEEMAEVLSRFYNQIETIEPPGTLEAGDVMRTGDHYYIGISERTNHSGANRLIELLNQFGMTGEKIELNDLLHLKSGVSYLEGQVLLVSGEFKDHPAFNGYQIIAVPENETYASNSLWINGTVLVPAGFPVTKENIEKAGYSTLSLEMSEFEKLDGGLSCLSLRF